MSEPFLKMTGISKVYPGIRERDSAALLRRFFAERRG